MRHIEKYIGDAVMAIWGAPAAHEDDAERPVRAALDLVAAVTGFGDRLGLELRLRVGVLTGEAAVEVARVGEGMVIGDTVNTAARLQTLASPGSVLVDQITRLATERAIAYEDAGTQRSALQLISVVGEAGVGKSRLAWELEKYADGLACLRRCHPASAPALRMLGGRRQLVRSPGARVRSRGAMR